MKGSYPRNISIIAAVFIFLILFLAIVNLYMSIQFRNEFVTYDREKVATIAMLCSGYLNEFSGQSELHYAFKNISTSFNLDHMIIADTLGNKVYDSRILPFDTGVSSGRVDFTESFGALPGPGEAIQDSDKFIFFNLDPPFYLYTSLSSSYTLIFDNAFKWHIIYITLSLLFIGFLGIFLIHNLFLPMRYVARLADDMGLETKKEDFVPATFNEIFRKIKSKEEALVEFSAYIAHEFRNSIGAIIGMVRLVEKGKKPAADIVDECRAMETLIKRLLEYSRPLKPVSVSIVVEQLIHEAVVKAAIPKRIEVRKRLETDMPQIVGDYELLAAAVTNLLQNSVAAIENRGFIEIETCRDNDLIHISITDNGSGVDEPELDKIFSPFYSKKEGGMGLGLAYVRKIMEIHHGRVEVVSKKGQGAKFILKIPV